MVSGQTLYLSCLQYNYAEYLYRVLISNNCKLPEQALYMIRYHSFYPWHTHGAYKYLCDDQDNEMLPWLQRFKYDKYILCSCSNINHVLIVSLICIPRQTTSQIEMH